jgi:hypothetical protein
MTLSIGTPTKILDNKTAEDGSYTALSDCTTVDMDAAISLDLEVLVTYGSASVTGCATLKVFASYDDTNYDTDPVEQFDLPFLINAARSQTFSIASRARYLKAQIVNTDSGANKDLTACYIYAHKQVVS